MCMFYGLYNSSPINDPSIYTTKELMIIYYHLANPLLGKDMDNFAKKKSYFMLFLKLFLKQKAKFHKTDHAIIAAKCEYILGK